MNTTKQNQTASSKGRVLTQAEKEQRTAALLGIFFRGVLFACIGYWSGSLALPFGAHPFGLALLCGAGKQAPFIAVGLLLSLRQMPHPLLYLITYASALLLRLLVGLLTDPKRGHHLSLRRLKRRTNLSFLWKDLFEEPFSTRILLGLLLAFFSGFFLLIQRGFLFYDLYGMLLSIAIVPPAVSLFAGLSFRHREDPRAHRRYVLAQLSLALVAIYATRSLLLYGISLSHFIALFVSLAAVKQYGLAKGVPVSALFGLAAEPILAPLFILASLGAAVLMPLSVTLGSTVALMIGIGYGYSVRGLGILNGLFSALLAASLLFSVLDKLFLHIGEKRSADKESAVSEQAAEESPPQACELLPADALSVLRLTQTEERLQRLCRGFDLLSQVLGEYSKGNTSPGQEYVAVCEEAFQSCCTGCPDHDLCYGEKARHTESEILRLGGLLPLKGTLSASDLSPELTERCGRLPDLLDEINHHASLWGSAAERYRKAELFAEDYRGFSQLISDLLAADHPRWRLDQPTGLALAAALSKAEPRITAVAVTGGEQKMLYLRSADKAVLAAPSSSLQAVCNRLLPFEADFKRGRLRDVQADTPLYEIEIPQKEWLSVKSAVRYSAAEGEELFCGDSAEVFHGDDHHLYACISDGMGSGREAAEASDLSGKLLHTLLTNGGSVRGSLELLNSLLRHRGNGSLHECSATVDLLTLDLLHGKAVFYKCGAAPTYILRSGSLVKLRSGTLPIGIMKQVDMGVIPCDIAPGDVIVMVSDGVTQGKEECPRLFELLQAKAKTSDPAQLATLILNDAKVRGSADDISVAVLKIS